MENWTVLTPIPLIMDAILKEIQKLYTDATFKFDPTLTYEESIRGVRSVRSSFDITKEQVFPLMTFSMTQLLPYTIVRKQFPHKKDIPNLAAKEYKARYCAFDINWRWYYSDIVAMKTFETMFATETSINLVKDVTLDMNDIGLFDYQVVWPWEGLAGISYNKKDNLYMSCDGSAKVMGEFVMASDIDSKLIGEIGLRVQNFMDKTYDSARILPTGTTWTNG